MFFVPLSNHYEFFSFNAIKHAEKFIFRWDMKINLFSGQNADKKIYEYIQEETVDAVVLDYILPQHKPNQWENSLYDYKRDIPNTHGDNVGNSLYECIKDIVAFHNSYGGYIVFGIDHYNINPIYGCDGKSKQFSLEKLNEKLHKYTGHKITCKLHIFNIQDKDIYLLLIPKRSETQTPIRLIKGSPMENGAQLFEASFIPVRIDDSCKKNVETAEDIQFLCSRRIFLSGKTNSIIDHNIPFIDKSYTKFFGRLNYFFELWSWFSNNKSGLRVLNAFGGMGKTSLAYEFCEQVLSVNPVNLDKIVWLTAKKQNFVTYDNSFQSLSRTDFSNVKSFLCALASHVGIPENKVNDIEIIDFLIDEIIDALKEFHLLIIIDDVDSLEKNEQLELNDIIKNLVSKSNNKSKALITSRLTLGNAPSQLISLEGLDSKDFKNYAEYIFAEYNIPFTSVPINRLHKISGGAPIFVSSILRLTRNMSINDAIEEYKGKSGEAVREFAFRREIESLTSIQIKIMFVICCLSSTTQVEIQNILDITHAEFLKDADELGSYNFLVKDGDPASGWKFSAPRQVALMLPVLKEKIINPERIEKACIASRRNIKRVPDRIASQLSAISALWQSGSNTEALTIALDAKETFPKNPDVMSFLGNAYLKIDKPDGKKSESSFRKAFELGGRRADLLDNWVLAKTLIKDWSGIIDLQSKFAPPEWKGQSVTSLVIAYKEIATQHAKKTDFLKVESYIKHALNEIKNAIIEKRALDRVSELRDECRELARAYIQTNKILYLDTNNFLKVFEAVLFVISCHITETWIIRDGIDAIYKWKENSSDKEFKFQKQRILEELVKIFARLTPTFSNRPELMQELQKCISCMK